MAVYPFPLTPALPYNNSMALQSKPTSFHCFHVWLQQQSPPVNSSGGPNLGISTVAFAMSSDYQHYRTSHPVCLAPPASTCIHNTLFPDCQLINNTSANHDKSNPAGLVPCATHQVASCPLSLSIRLDQLGIIMLTYHSKA